MGPIPRTILTGVTPKTADKSRKQDLRYRGKKAGHCLIARHRIVESGCCREEIDVLSRIIPQEPRSKNFLSANLPTVEGGGQLEASMMH